MTSTHAGARIHPSAIVDPDAVLAPGVDIGPWCVLSGAVRLGEGVRLVANVHIHGPAEIGANTILYPFACIGFPPQDFKFKLGDRTAGVKIGPDCIIRESVTIHAATSAEVPTTLGARVFMMACSHVGHDGRLGSNVIMANSALVAGHGQVGDNVMFSGNAAIHQFVRVGRLAFLTGNEGSSMDVPPFCTLGSRNTIHTVNLVGMRRSGMPREHVTAVREAFWHVLRRPIPRPEVVEMLRERGRDCPPVMEMAEFVAAAKRPIARGLASAVEEPVA
jgi:UDP-N-acetylglucosamine acyltransferase